MNITIRYHLYQLETVHMNLCHQLFDPLLKHVEKGSESASDINQCTPSSNYRTTVEKLLELDQAHGMYSITKTKK